MATEEELTKMLEQLDDRKLNQFADNLRRLALFVGKQELQKALARKIAKFEKRLSAVEQWQQQPASVRKSIEGQDDESEPDKWPSLSKLFEGD